MNQHSWKNIAWGEEPTGIKKTGGSGTARYSFMIETETEKRKVSCVIMYIVLLVVSTATSNKHMLCADRYPGSQWFYLPLKRKSQTGGV